MVVKIHPVVVDIIPQGRGKGHCSPVLWLVVFLKFLNPLLINMLNPNASQSIGLAHSFDLNSDGRVDYLSGFGDRLNVSLQQADGGFKSRSLTPPTADPGWALVGTADFDGDRVRDDLFWRNSTTGQTTVALGQGEQSPLLAYAATQSRDYTANIADFNGDGRADILWHNPSQGKVEMWFMGGDRVVQALPDVPTTWVPNLVNFNQDGKTDLFWQDNATGEFTTWLLDGAQLLGSQKVQLPGNAGNLEFYDFNGDGRTDIFDRNRLTGMNRLWLWGEDGLQPNPQPVMLPFSQPDGSFIFADFNGDGRTDTLFRSPGGVATTWMLQADNTVTIAGVPGLKDFAISQVLDLNGDGKTDLLLENQRQNQAQLWSFDGASWRSVRDFTVNAVSESLLPRDLLVTPVSSAPVSSAPPTPTNLSLASVIDRLIAMIELLPR